MESSWEHLESLWKRLGDLMEASWKPVGSSWRSLAGLLEVSWGALCSALLSALCSAFRAEDGSKTTRKSTPKWLQNGSKIDPGASWSALEAVLTAWKSLGGLLERSWALLERSWEPLGQLWGALGSLGSLWIALGALRGSLLDPPGDVLRALGDLSATSQALLEPT